LERLEQLVTRRPGFVAWALALLVIALPLVIWFDLRQVARHNIHHHVAELNRFIGVVRAYYSDNVADRILHAGSDTQLVHNYLQTPGAIPIPATMSIELGEALTAIERGVEMRFVSDFPFADRDAPELTVQEFDALSQFRADPTLEQLFFFDGNALQQSVTMATPIYMSQTCVDCHNSHEDSTKTDWIVGDVRGVQTVSMQQPIVLNIWGLQGLLIYVLVAGVAGLTFALLQIRQSTRYRGMNAELTENNIFLADISIKLSKYLSPQVYRSIFSGEKDTTLTTERKKLTVFFSDIKDFTATSEALQPEELTALLNEYFTEMSKIAEAHGATIDKFIGDAIIAFFGDPTTRGTAEDARACLRMALAMQQRLRELEHDWRARGIDRPFQARMGINTGFCNVGNFGSEDRMDYTIIGAEANLAARLEGIADPGGIVMSYETQALVSDMVTSHALPPQRFKGIARDVVPYAVDMPDFTEAWERHRLIESENSLTIQLDRLDPTTRARLRDAVADLVAKSQRS